MEAWRSSWCAGPAGASTSRRCWSATGCGCRSRAGCRSPRRRRRAEELAERMRRRIDPSRIDVAARARRLAREYGLPRARRRCGGSTTAPALGIVHARRRHDPRVVAARGVSRRGCSTTCSSTSSRTCSSRTTVPSTTRSSTGSRSPSAPGASSIAMDLDPYRGDDATRWPLLGGRRSPVAPVAPGVRLRPCRTRRSC